MRLQARRTQPVREMRAGFRDPEALQQRLALWTVRELAGLVFKPGRLFGYALFKGAGLLYPAAMVSHGAPQAVKNDSNGEPPIQFRQMNLASGSVARQQGPPPRVRPSRGDPAISLFQFGEQLCTFVLNELPQR